MTHVVNLNSKIFLSLFSEFNFICKFNIFESTPLPVVGGVEGSSILVLKPQFIYVSHDVDSDSLQYPHEIDLITLVLKLLVLLLEHLFTQEIELVLLTEGFLHALVVHQSLEVVFILYQRNVQGEIGHEFVFEGVCKGIFLLSHWLTQLYQKFFQILACD